MHIAHYEKVDINNITAVFTTDGLHRPILTLPFIERDPTQHYLCVIGQNSSHANQTAADKTLHYLANYIFNQLPQYAGIVMLNLFSRIDTKKQQNQDLLRLDCERQLKQVITQHNDFLLVYGRLKKKDSKNGAYNFVKKAQQLKLRLAGKNVFKIDIGTDYPPHPGNRQIYYRDIDFAVSRYDFGDLG